MSDPHSARRRPAITLMGSAVALRMGAAALAALPATPLRAEMQGQGPQAKALSQTVQQRAAQDAAGPSCLDGQVGGATARRLTDATVEIFAVFPDGRTAAIGSGAIIANSATVNAPNNKIVTANHVAERIEDMGKAAGENRPARFVAVSGKGELLGDVAVDTRTPGYAIAEGRFLDNRDSASLRLSNPTPAYLALPGIPLSRMSSPSVMTALVTEPVRGAPINNMSGGGVTDGEGLIGLATAGYFSLRSVSFDQPGDPGILNLHYSKALPQTVRLIVNAIGPEVRVSLGAAGTAPVKAEPYRTQAVAAGFPNELCRAYTIEARTADFRDPGTVDLITPADGLSKPRALAPGWNTPKEAEHSLTGVLQRGLAAATDPDTVKVAQDALLLSGKGLKLAYAEIYGMSRMDDALEKLERNVASPVLRHDLRTARENFMLAALDAAGRLPSASVPAAPVPSPAKKFHARPAAAAAKAS